MTAEKRRVKGLYWDRALYLVEGCRKVDETCAHCWAERMAARFLRQGAHLEAGVWSGVATFVEEKLKEVKKKRCVGYTWAIWNDLFHPVVEPGAVRTCLKVFREHPADTFLILTKRIKRAWYVLEELGVKELPENVWIGTSIGSTGRVASFYRLKELLSETKVRCRKMLSIEPMLGAVNLSSFKEKVKKLELVICGCESGQQRRKPETKWLDDLIRECAHYQLPLFLKQWDFTGNKLIKPEDFPWKYRGFTDLPF